jgi:hypothetical protein
MKFVYFEINHLECFALIFNMVTKIWQCVVTSWCGSNKYLMCVVMYSPLLGINVYLKYVCDHTW